MKKTAIIIIVAFSFIFTYQFSVQSHQGRTDSSGGHYDRSTGEYHYHHGLSAHYHINGECPYSSGTTKSSNISNSQNSHNAIAARKENNIILPASITFIALVILIIYILRKRKK